MGKDILITPGSASIQYSGSAHAQVELLIQDSGSLSWQGSGSGQLFSITNASASDSVSASIMAVTDNSGIPILEVFQNNEVKANGFRGWRPYINHSANFDCVLSQSGYYMRCGGLITASITASSLIPFPLGTEIEFIQTESTGNTMITSSGAGVTINSKNNNWKLAGQWSAATIKKVGTDEWDLVGDLT